MNRFFKPIKYLGILTVVIVIAAFTETYVADWISHICFS